MIKKPLFHFFLISFLLGVLFSADAIGLRFYATAKYVELLLFGILTVHFIRKPNVQRDMPLMIACGVFFSSFLGILQFINQKSINGIFYFFGERFFTSETPGIANMSVNGELLLRAYATFPHPNVFAGYLTLCLLILYFGVVQTGSSLRKNFYLSSLLVGSIALFLTFSRTAIFCWFVLIAVLVIGRMRKKSISLYVNTKRMVLVMSIAVGVSVLTLTPLFSRMTQTNFQEEAVQQRIMQVNESVQIFSISPILGAGFMGYLPTGVRENIFSQSQKPEPVHNVVLLYFAQTGVVGIAVLLALFVSQIKRRLSLMQKLLLFSLITLGMTDHYFLTLQQGQLLLALGIGMLLMTVKSDSDFNTPEGKIFPKRLRKEKIIVEKYTKK